MKLTLALSKGRIFEETAEILSKVGIVPLEDPEKSRKLIIETSNPDVRLIIVRASDVPTYVQFGGADFGVAGLDVLMEKGAMVCTFLTTWILPGAGCLSRSAKDLITLPQ